MLTFLAQTSTLQQLFTGHLFHECPVSEDLCNSIFAKPYLPENFTKCAGYHCSNYTVAGEVRVHLPSDLSHHCHFGETLLMPS